MRPCRKTVTSAPTRKPAPIRKSASRSGWRGDASCSTSPRSLRGGGEAGAERRLRVGRGNAPDAIVGLSGQQIASPETARPERFVILTSAVLGPPGLQEQSDLSPQKGGESLRAASLLV